jgi:hypothetical protein
MLNSIHRGCFLVNQNQSDCLSENQIGVSAMKQRTNPAFKLTINYPAQKLFFTEDSVGIRIKIEPGLDGIPIYFRPVSHLRTPDSVSFTKRPRGGYYFNIQGSNSTELLDILLTYASIERPFFTMHKSKNGWLGLKHYTDVGAPPKTIPHVRLWMSREKYVSEMSPMNDEISEILGDFSLLVRGAKHSIDEHARNGKLGRPPADVLDSRVVLAAFQALNEEIFANECHSKLDTKSIQTAIDLLKTVLESMPNSPVMDVPMVPIIDTHHDTIEYKMPEMQKPKRGRPRKQKLPAVIYVSTQGPCSLEKPVF